MDANSIKIKHLYHRAGFGLDWQDWSSIQSNSYQNVLERFFSDSEKIEEIQIISRNPVDYVALKEMDKEEKRKYVNERRKIVREEIRDLNVFWINQMKSTKSVLREKMTLFWHNHFACRPRNSYTAQMQNNTLRKNALGSFRTLLLEISKDPEMLFFLNNQQNRKEKPNENFARELMELFTLGRGNYSEMDIKEAARAFTGWSINPETIEFIFREKQHDFGQKTFFGKTGDFNGEQVIDMILDKKETAYFITKKIYRYLVNDVIDEKKVKILAENFYKSEYNIELLLKEIFNAKWFTDLVNIGTRIKSPIELIVGYQKQLPMSFDNPESFLFIQKVLGQVLFVPPNVAGWAEGKTWIDSTTLLFRLKLPELLFKAGEIKTNIQEDADVEMKSNQNQLKKFSIMMDWQALKTIFQQASRTSMVSEIYNYLIQPQKDTKIEFINQMVSNEGEENLIEKIMLEILSLPEYQMC